jgi:hypothetical protein
MHPCRSRAPRFNSTMTKLASIIIAISVPLVLLAFWPLYLSRPLAASDRYTHFHAITGSLWLCLLIVQPLAIQRYRFTLHRSLGRSSFVLAPLFFIAGILLSHHRLASMDETTFAVEGYSHFLPFYASVVFGTAYLLGLKYRHLPDAHGRFMLLTAIPLIDPVVGRILFFYFPPLPHPLLYQAVTFSLETIVAAVLVFSYKGAAQPRRALLGYFVLLLTLETGWFTFAWTEAWLYLVGVFRGLPLT